MKNNEGVKKAKEKLEEISNDPIMQRIADWKEKYILEMNTTKTDGYNLGEINKEKEIAKKLKQENISLEIISKTTGLSIDEIEKL